MLDAQEVAHALSLFTPQRLSKDEFLVAEGRVCHQLAFLVNGSVRAFSTDDDGVENIICFSFEQTFITAYESLMRRIPSVKSIQAMEDCEALVIGAESLQQLMARNPSWLAFSRAVMEQEFIEKEHYRVYFGNKPAREKYRNALLHYPEVIRRVKVEYLASYLGMTTRTLARVKREVVLDSF